MKRKESHLVYRWLLGALIALLVLGVAMLALSQAVGGNVLLLGGEGHAWLHGLLA